MQSLLNYHPMTNPASDPPVEERIRNFIARDLLYNTGGFTYSDEASFILEGIVDSLGIMQLVEFVQESFRVTVEQQEITSENFDSVSKLGGFIRRKLPSDGSPAQSAARAQ